MNDASWANLMVLSPDYHNNFDDTERVKDNLKNKKKDHQQNVLTNDFCPA